MDPEITSIRDETSKIKAFVLRSPDGRELPPFTAGAQVNMTVVLLDGTSDKRSYSLAGNPADQSHYEIAVNDLPNNGDGSTSMHTQRKEGNTLRGSDSIKTFPLSHDALHHVLIPAALASLPF